jgi:hypothetical protein
VRLAKRMERDDATYAGLLIGRERRHPNRDEQQRWLQGSRGLALAFLRGLERGHQQGAQLQQLTIEGLESHPSLTPGG